MCLKARARTSPNVTGDLSTPPFLSIFHVSIMSKRDGESIHRGNTRSKKHKGCKIHSTLIPDSDEEIPTPSANANSVRWVKTRVTTSGQVGSVTTSSVPLSEVADNTNGPRLEADTEHARDTILEDTMSATPVTQRKRKKENDSVSFPSFLLSHRLTTI